MDDCKTKESRSTKNILEEERRMILYDKIEPMF